MLLFTCKQRCSVEPVSARQTFSSFLSVCVGRAFILHDAAAVWSPWQPSQFVNASRAPPPHLITQHGGAHARQAPPSVRSVFQGTSSCRLDIFRSNNLLQTLRVASVSLDALCTRGRPHRLINRKTTPR